MDKTVKRMVELRNQGLTLVEISKELGIPETSIRRKLKKTLSIEEYSQLKKKAGRPTTRAKELCPDASCGHKNEWVISSDLPPLTKLILEIKHKTYKQNICSHSVEVARAQLRTAKEMAIRQSNLDALRVIDSLESKLLGW